MTDETSSSAEPRERLLMAALDASAEAIAVLSDDRVVFVNRALHRLLATDTIEGVEALLRPILGSLSVEARRPPPRALHGRFMLPHPTGRTYLDLSILPLEAGPRDCQALFARKAREWEESEQAISSKERLMSLGRLAASVAHDINNPLSYLLGSIELAERSLRQRAEGSFEVAPGSAILDAIVNAREGVERLRARVRDLMAFSRPVVESNSLVDVESLLDASIKLAWNEIRHRARLVKRYGRVPQVYGDEPRLTQVFLNLLVNAAQSIDERSAAEAEIVLSTRLEGDRIVVEVADTGSGVDESELSDVFEPFAGDRTASSGSGLGLSICRSIVTSHGGEIAVETRKGRGALFRVSLPRPRGAPPASTGVSEPAPPAAVHARARILVIDDEPLLGQTLGFAFSGRHDVVVTASGREALAFLAKDSRFDLVLCDLMMPDVTGQKVYETVERDFPALVPNFVFMTGGAFTESAQNFLESHPGRRIEKPFTMSEIEQLL